MAATPHLRPDLTVRGEVVPRSEPVRRHPSPAAHRRPRVGDLLRFAWRLGGRAGAPAAATVAALASPISRIAAGPQGSRPLVSLRVDGQDQPVLPGVVADLARDRSGRVVVLVPASGGDELTWLRGVDGTGATYGDRLAALLGWSPVSLRYDAWAHDRVHDRAHDRAHDSGAGLREGPLILSALLQRLVDAWPVPVTRLVLIAAGDGGLLARGALGVRRHEPRPWTALVTELVALDTPSLAVDRAWAPALGRRLEEGLAGLVAVGPEVLDVSPLDHVDYLLIGDGARARPHPVGRALGGLLRWRRGSRGVHDLFPSAERFEVRSGGQPLVNHPEIHDALLRWLV